MSQQEMQEDLMELITGNQKIIYKICNSYCSQRNDREDLAQEIIYQLLKSYRSYKQEYKFSTWMYRVALNVAISFYRKKKTTGTVIYEPVLPDHKQEVSTVGELENNLAVLEQFINELKELDKALMILYLESKSYKEIAEILGISETNVATKINRIKEILKKKFLTLK